MKMVVKTMNNNIVNYNKNNSNRANSVCFIKWMLVFTLNVFI